MKKKVVIIVSIIVVLIICFIIYCRHFGTKGLIVKEYLIKNENIPESFYGTKIVHLSDIHYGRITKSNELKKIEKKIKKIKPDMVIVSGDLLDKDIKYTDKDIEDIINFLNNIETKFGKYIISGEHDILKDEYQEILDKVNFINLDDSYQILYNNSKEAIMISGISTIGNNIDLKEKLEKIEISDNQEDDVKYSILVIHEPDIIDDIDYSKYDLILAGHSHNGQVILPLFGQQYLPKNAKKYYDEYYKLDDTDFYISSGIGTSGNNLRLNNKPSFNLYRLVNE